VIIDDDSAVFRVRTVAVGGEASSCEEERRCWT
jgi:hypothetical protein